MELMALMSAVQDRGEGCQMKLEGLSYAWFRMAMGRAEMYKVFTQNGA